MSRLFGTDGVRGVANSELTPEMAFRLGAAHGSLLIAQTPRPRVVIGKDTRISGDMLEGAYLAGLCMVGVDVLLAGVIPTPAVAFLVRRHEANGGLMISASHNPIEDNGLKLFSAEGFKISDEMENRIEEMVFSGDDWGPRPTGEDVGRVQRIADAEDVYVDHLKKQLGGDLSGLKVVLDCAHGAAYRVGPRLFRELGAQVTAIHDAPDGININVNCGSTHPGMLKKLVAMQGADAGLAFDGDADRCLAVDGRGRLVDGDQIMLALAVDLKSRNRLNGDLVVATVMSNLGLEVALKQRGIKLLRTGVGDRFVLEEMRRIDGVLGGEQSGHIIQLDVGPTGDGCFTGARLMQVLKQSGKSLEELVAEMKHMPQILVNVKARNRSQLSQDDAIAGAIAEMEDVLKDRGRLLVRVSGTEPLVRVMAEGPDEQELQQLVGRLAQLIEERLA